MVSVDITPSPRVLRMLGQIDFQPWQCLAELIDNSIDAFIDQMATGNPAVLPRIYIQLPNETQLRSGDGAITIKDTAGGMSVEDMKNAVRAGYSGNDPVEKMGLFGMGFNISTARMGRRTEVWTTQSEDPEWTGIIIDFDTLEQQKTFHVPMEKRNKTQNELSEGCYGTEIRITRLEADRVRPLIRGAGKKKTRDRLGKIYGRVMARLGIEINYDGDRVVPWQHCAWDAIRSVETQAFGRVPARVEIDKTLDSRRFCTTCWVWLHDNEETCSSCGHSNNVIERPRHIKGWLGIQRYFDKNHYGIDLIRNGRVIEDLDKSFFTFIDENGDPLFEYPIDAIHWGGRIIGELEIDFVRVSHQKDAFDKLDPEWKRVVELIRGNSPLQPKIAERMGLGKNDSPLAKLFTAYRKGTAGLKDLVPGTPEGNGLNSGLVQQYVDKFYSFDPNYQSDKKWYELVLQAERGKRGESSGAYEAAGDFPLSIATTALHESSSPIAPKQETERLSLPLPFSTNPVKEEPELDAELSLNYQISELPGDIMIKVAAYRHKKDINNEPFTIKPEGYSFRFDYNPCSRLFEESLETPADCLLVDLAQHFLALSAESTRSFPVSKIALMLRERYFPMTSGDLQSSAASAEAMIQELRRHYDELLPEVAPIDIKLIQPSQLTHIKRIALQAENIPPADIETLISAGQFGRFISNNYVIEIFKLWPSLATDGRFFSNSYSILPNELKELMTGELIDGLHDVLWLSDEGVSTISKDAGWKLRYSKALASLRLLQFKRA